MPILKAIPATVLTAVAAAAAVNLEVRVRADLAPVGLDAMIADLAPAAAIATAVDRVESPVAHVGPAARRMIGIATVRRVLRRSPSAKSSVCK